MNPHDARPFLSPEEQFDIAIFRRNAYEKALRAILAFTDGANLYADKMSPRGALEAIAHIVKEALGGDQ